MAEFRLFLPDDEGAIIGETDDDGILTFAITAQRTARVRGTEMFDLMLRAFGPRTRKILGVWRLGAAGSPSINLDKVNHRTAAGASLVEAIRETWTYTRAARHGFVKIIPMNVDGTVGMHTKIDVLFERDEDVS